MKNKRLLLTASIILTFVTMIACAFSSAATPTPVSNSPATLVSNTDESPAASPTPLPTKTASPTATTITSVSGKCANAYYPVAEGNTWLYSSTGGYMGDYTYTRTVADVSDAGFTTSELYSTGTNWTSKWTCEGGNLSALDAGSDSLSLATSDMTLTTTSITATGYNIPDSFDRGNTWSEVVTLVGSVVNSAGEKTDGQIVVNFDCTAAGTDTVTVPVGTFDTVTAKCTKKVVVTGVINGKSTQLGANQEAITYSYAKDVGFVKSVATGGRNNETVVLTDYKIP